MTRSLSEMAALQPIRARLVQCSSRSSDRPRSLPALSAYACLRSVGRTHQPTVALKNRWTASLSLGLVNGAVVSMLCASCFPFMASGRFPAAFAPLRLLPSSLWVQIPVTIVVLDFVTYVLQIDDKTVEKALRWLTHP